MIRNLLLATTFAMTGIAVAATELAEAPVADALDDTPWELPEMPPRCTRDQAASGDVDDCLLAFFGEPYDDGYGHPPDPGVGEGWKWKGYTYSGSPALADWEDDHIVANDETLAGFRPGYLETHEAVQVLFESFIAEIDANGYEVRGASGYSFRCTSGNGGWDCPSGDADDLSLHAYGIAIDMNAGTNPITTYTGKDGATACRTPMETDIPRWVVQTAEKWGLYWGGYGWSSGCKTADTERTSVYRDPPHFEFRGTPEQARAIAAFNAGEDPTIICTTVVDDDGDDVESCSRATKPGAGTRIPVSPDAPDGTEAVLVNLTAAAADDHGFLTLESCGPQEAARTTSALTYGPTQAVATMAVVPLDDDGRFCVYRSSPVHSIVDVVAFLGPDGEPVDGTDPETELDPGADPAPEALVDESLGTLWVAPSTPTRLTDTRRTGSCRPRQECQDGPVPDASEHQVPTADPAARIANIAVVQGSAPGYLQAGRCGEVGDGAYSNLNYGASTTRSNLAVVEGGDAGSCVFALTRTHVIVDELGRLDPEQGYGWQLDPSRRVLDTRECDDTWCDELPDDGQMIKVDLDTEAAGAVVALTVTQPSDRGYVSAGRCSELTAEGDPTTSNVNYRRGQTVTNLALVGLEDGEMCIFTLAAAHLVIDVQAELVETHDIGLTATTTTRVHDSREPDAR